MSVIREYPLAVGEYDGQIGATLTGFKDSGSRCAIDLVRVAAVSDGGFGTTNVLVGQITYQVFVPYSDFLREWRSAVL